MAVHPERECSQCRRLLPKEQFSAKQWKGAKKCRECTAKVVAGTAVESRTCSVCKANKQKEEFSSKQWAGGRKCKACVGEELKMISERAAEQKTCAECYLIKGKEDFSAKQWSAEEAKCIECMTKVVDVKMCSQCLTTKEKKEFSSTQWGGGRKCRDCSEQQRMASSRAAEEKSCVNCKAKKGKEEFSINQWIQGFKCKDCAEKASRDNKKAPSDAKKCSVCQQIKDKEQFSTSQWFGGHRCMTCAGQQRMLSGKAAEEKACVECKVKKAKDEFSTSQWFGGHKCMTCAGQQRMLSEKAAEEKACVECKTKKTKEEFSTSQWFGGFKCIACVRAAQQLRYLAEETKKCTGCEQEKRRDAFSKSQLTGRGRCVDCAKEMVMKNTGAGSSSAGSLFGALSLASPSPAESSSSDSCAASSSSSSSSSSGPFSTGPSLVSNPLAFSLGSSSSPLANLSSGGSSVAGPITLASTLSIEEAFTQKDEDIKLSSEVRKHVEQTISALVNKKLERLNEKIAYGGEPRFFSFRCTGSFVEGLALRENYDVDMNVIVEVSEDAKFGATKQFVLEKLRALDDCKLLRELTRGVSIEFEGVMFDISIALLRKDELIKKLLLAFSEKKPFELITKQENRDNMYHWLRENLQKYSDVSKEEAENLLGLVSDLRSSYMADQPDYVLRGIRIIKAWRLHFIKSSTHDPAVQASLKKSIFSSYMLGLVVIFISKEQEKHSVQPVSSLTYATFRFLLEFLAEKPQVGIIRQVALTRERHGAYFSASEAAEKAPAKAAGPVLLDLLNPAQNLLNKFTPEIRKTMLDMVQAAIDPNLSDKEQDGVTLGHNLYNCRLLQSKKLVILIQILTSLI
eukprot:g77475.t1